MTAPAPPKHPLIRRLLELDKRDDRGALAALRRGLGKPPGAAPEMYPYVEPFIPVDDYAVNVDAAYLVASLFGLHRTPATPSEDREPRHHRGFGASLARIRFREGTADEDDGVVRRFTALLSSDREGLPTHLRNLVTLLHSRSRDTPIDYEQLFYDLCDWDHPDREVQRAWAAGFWRRAAAAADDAQPSDPGEPATDTDPEE